jgi:hypothetical protein
MSRSYPPPPSTSMACSGTALLTLQIYRPMTCFGETCYLHLQGLKWNPFPIFPPSDWLTSPSLFSSNPIKPSISLPCHFNLKMEAACFSQPLFLKSYISPLFPSIVTSAPEDGGSMFLPAFAPQILYKPPISQHWHFSP